MSHNPKSSPTVDSAASGEPGQVRICEGSIRSLSAKDFLTQVEIREMEFLISLKDTIKNRFMQVMSERGFTPQQMREHLGYDQSTLSDILNPDKHISTFHMFGIMDRLSQGWTLSSHPIDQPPSCSPDIEPSPESAVDNEKSVLSSLSAKLARVPSAVALAVAELPDRTSPDDRPEMMLVTAEEISEIVRTEIESATGSGGTLLVSSNSAD